MKACPSCLNLAPDTAVACELCGTILDASVVANAARPSGHRMPTVVEAPDAGRTPPPSFDLRPSPPPPLPAPVPPTPPAAPGPGRRGHTVFMGFTPSATAGAGPAQSAPRVAERRVIGILITYSWSPEGQVFPIREGRNLIGRGDQCDIRVPEDPAMSEVNSHITFRQNFVVGDMVSMSGTDLNGEPVEEQFRPLGNYAKIRTGSTNWIFVILDPALAGVV